MVAMMTNVYTQDLDSEFFPALAEVCEELSTEDSVVTPLNLLSVMYSESGVRHDAHNPNGDASGLIQFMPATLGYVGWTKSAGAFRVLSAKEQLIYVKRYYLPHRGKLGSRVAIYLATFLPALIDHADDPTFVLAAKGGGRSGIIFNANASFDANKDGRIEVQELDQAIERNDRGIRWEEIKNRLGDTSPSEAPDAGDLGTVFGIQSALKEAGFDPGTIDGWMGAKTRKAIISFQLAKGLASDGVVGPATKAALLA